MILGDTVVTSMHVLFGESIPDNFLRDLDEATVKCDPKSDGSVTLIG